MNNGNPAQDAALLRKHISALSAAILRVTATLDVTTVLQTFQGTPLRHRGRQVGNLFLAEKEGGTEFTDEDEEVLVMFASLAATAIANAHTHRDEQRARAYLEALVETSPVGVLTCRRICRG